MTWNVCRICGSEANGLTSHRPWCSWTLECMRQRDQGFPAQDWWPWWMEELRDEDRRWEKRRSRVD